MQLRLHVNLPISQRLECYLSHASVTVSPAKGKRPEGFAAPMKIDDKWRRASKVSHFTGITLRLHVSQPGPTNSGGGNSYQFSRTLIPRKSVSQCVAEMYPCTVVRVRP